MPPLISCLSAKDEQTVRDAIDALCNLIQTNSARASLKRIGGIKPVVRCGVTRLIQVCANDVCRLFLKCNLSSHARIKQGCLSILSSLATMGELRVRPAYFICQFIHLLSVVLACVGRRAWFV